MPRLDIEAELNGPQLEAVNAIEGPVLIIAGAGSGKTRVITCRIAHMLEKGIPQSAILALTFTNKAAKEMETRVKELTGKKLQALTVSTFHAFGVKILREEIETLGYRKNFSIYDEGDRISLIKESLRDCKISADGVDLYALGQLFSGVKTGRLKWGLSDASGRYADSVWQPVFEEYLRSLKLFNAVDFDDLLTVPITLFDEHPEILEKYRGRYRYLMVDEFQDTSFIQYRLLKLLAWGNGSPNPGVKSPNVCVVGDDDQSIYSWRGASYENIVRFEKDFPGTKEIKLEQNYRSTTTILEAANGLIANNSSRKEKRLWSGNSGGKPIEIFFPADENDEAEFIASQINILHLEENLRYNDFGVLVRTNSQFDVIEEVFLANDIPCKVSGGKSFFERKEIKDILSYLRVIANTEDDVNLLRIINTPRRGIGKASIAMLSDLARKNHSTLWDSLSRYRLAKEHGQENLFESRETHGGREGEKARGEIEGFADFIEKQREVFFAKGELSKKVKALADEINYWGYLLTEYGKNEKAARYKYANIDYLCRMISRWEKDPGNPESGLYAYLNRVSLLLRSDGDGEGDKSKVSLMTIHAAKGLEFPVVFIAGAEDGIIPHERSMEDLSEGDAEPLEEERRLFYVAITRARDKLYITSCKKRKHRHDIIECSPSPFLDEIPQNLTVYHKEEKELSPEQAGDFFAKMRELYGNGDTCYH